MVSPRRRRHRYSQEGRAKRLRIVDMILVEGPFLAAALLRARYFRFELLRITDIFIAIIYAGACHSICAIIVDYHATEQFDFTRLAASIADYVIYIITIIASR